MSSAREFAVSAFAAVDTMDAEKMAIYLHEQCNFAFGNAPAVDGRAHVQAYVAGFYGMIAAIHHEIEDVWQVEDRIISQLRVTYTRKDGSQLSCPAATIWQIREALIADYRIYVDNSSLFVA